MNAATSASAPQAFQQGVVRTYDFLTPEQDFGARVQEGLSRANKSLPWEILFDTSGVQLFAEACAQPEYLAARIERAILDACIGEIAEFVHGDSQYLDLGCHGVSSAVTLIEHPRPSIYLPVDTSFKALGSRIAQVSQAYPWLNV